MSLAHGHGDPHWFFKLSREDRALMLARRRIDNPPPPSGLELLRQQAHLRGPDDPRALQRRGPA